MVKRKNWEDLLASRIEFDKATIISELPDKIKREMRIKFKCHCGEEYEKVVRKIVEETGALCEKCTKLITKDKKKKTFLKNYGVEHPFKSEEIREKIKKTFVEKYGVENPFQSEKIRNKIKDKNLDKYGFEYFTQVQIYKDKTIKTNLERYGVKCNLQLESVKEKIRETNIKKYGFPSPMQNLEIFQKSRSSLYSKKEYKFKTGETVKIQGYEPLALDLLQEQGYNFEDIKIEGVIIAYELDDIKRNHFPDIYIPKENRIIEVKSDYTYDKELEKNLQKKKGAIEQKYIYNFWIFNKKGELTIN